MRAQLPPPSPPPHGSGPDRSHPNTKTTSVLKSRHPNRLLSGHFHVFCLFWTFCFLEAEPEQWRVHWICGQFGRWKLQKVKRGEHFLVFCFFHGAESSAQVRGLTRFERSGIARGAGAGARVKKTPSGYLVTLPSHWAAHIGHMWRSTSPNMRREGTLHSPLPTLNEKPVSFCVQNPGGCGNPEDRLTATTTRGCLGASARLTSPATGRWSVGHDCVSS